ncbi:RHO1 GDP-GTP exchange protein 2 [Massospora cicadina]|nr:RHO1 GDP-GTP exchange protein 2 [Massospora cicadina]
MTHPTEPARSNPTNHPPPLPNRPTPSCSEVSLHSSLSFPPRYPEDPPHPTPSFPPRYPEDPPHPTPSFPPRYPEDLSLPGAPILRPPSFPPRCPEDPPHPAPSFPPRCPEDPPHPTPSFPPRCRNEIDSVIELYSNLNTSQSSLSSYLHLSKNSNDSRLGIEPGPEDSAAVAPNRITPLDRPNLSHLRDALQKRTSISRLTMLGMDLQIGRLEGAAHSGLLSEIVSQFRRTSQEVMTGCQILDYLEIAAALPLKARYLSQRIGSALEGYDIFRHTGEDGLPILDGDEEIYVVNIGRLQHPAFAPKAVLTYLTRCYYPTCSIARPCAAPGCPTKRLLWPREVGELKVINVTPDWEACPPSSHHVRKPDSFDSQMSADSETLFSPGPSNDSGSEMTVKDAELWVQAVPVEVSNAVSEDERKRQELIFETIRTEADFVRDLALIDTIFAQRMRQGDVYASDRVDAVLFTLFSNYSEILATNLDLLEGLKGCQRLTPVVSSIGEVFLGWALNLECYVRYGSRLAYAQDFIRQEMEYNPSFANYLRDCERHPQARRLSIQSFVGRATTRLGRYPLLLQGILKKTPAGNPDQVLIPQVLDLLRAKLEEVNRTAGEAEERLKVNFISSHLFFKPEDAAFDIDLEHRERRLIREGVLRRATGHGSQAVTAFLFDNALVLAKEKKRGVVEYRAVCPAIPVYAMLIVDEVSPKTFRLAESLLLSQKSPSDVLTLTGGTDSSFGFSITHHGRKNVTHYLMATSARERSQWVEALHAANEASPQASAKAVQVRDLYQSSVTQNHIFGTTGCKLGGESHYLMGCENGVYVLTPGGALRRIIKSASRVIQLEALDQYHLLVVLYADKYLMAYHLDVVLDDTGHLASGPTKISENVSFFRIGHCSHRHLLISAKYHSQKSNFKTMQLVHFGSENKASQKNKLLWQSRHATGLRVVKKFYVGTIGNGISFLKTKLVIACGPGFEIVDLEALYLNRGIPDRSSPAIADNPRFVALFESCTPIAMYRINPSEFLLCYREFGFYVDNGGRPSRGPDSALEWDGVPSDFVYAHPYVLGFGANLIEIRRVDTGRLEQILLTSNLQFTNPSEALRDELHCVAEVAGSPGQRFFKLVLNPPPPPYLEFSRLLSPAYLVEGSVGMGSDT